MMLHNYVVGSFHITDEHVSIFDLYSEFSLKGFVDLDRSINVEVSSLITPVGVETEWYSLHIIISTFHLWGSKLFNLWLMQLMILLAVRPG